jgi:hypothetical protein
MEYSPKPEGKLEMSTKPATGSVEPNNDTDVEKEVAAMGVNVTPIGGHGQGGEGH